MNKKGSHVGFVISFVMFITFLLFLYSITAPVTRIERGKESVLEYLETAILEDLFEADLTSASVSLSNGFVQSNGPKCIKIRIKNLGDDLVSITKNDSNHKFSSSFRNDKNTKIDWDGESKFLKIFYSQEFEADSYNPNCPLTFSSQYTLGLVRTEEHIFESRIINVSNFVNANVQNYAEVKEILGVPLGDEFGFTFRNDEGEEIGTLEEDIEASDYAAEIPIQYVDEEANIKPGFLTIRVW